MATYSHFCVELLTKNEKSRNCWRHFSGTDWRNAIAISDNAFARRSTVKHQEKTCGDAVLYAPLDFQPLMISHHYSKYPYTGAGVKPKSVPLLVRSFQY